MSSDELLSQLYYSEYSKLLIYARAVLQNTDLAEDAVQETFYIALQHTDTLTSHPNPQGWLMQTLKYTICNLNRSYTRYLLHFVSIDPQILHSKDPAVLPPDRYSDAEALLRITKNLLSPEDFYLLKRIVFDSADHGTVANELNISVSVSYKRLERIRKKLKKEFQRQDLI